jgi:hypothetical protein
VLRGVRTAHDVLGGLLASGVLVCDSRHYDATKNKARTYRLSDGFKGIDTFAKIRWKAPFQRSSAPEGTD